MMENLLIGNSGFKEKSNKTIYLYRKNGIFMNFNFDSHIFSYFFQLIFIEIVLSLYLNLNNRKKLRCYF
jgi:hypothetical protein